ncbi:hypothetical protein OEG86_22850 [Hoeflea alexandrii]|uniref:hypothetical protein n=1 Tax=Hoeflea alexandrii TaxID=288436 RepID=UPI00226E7B0A|nr:hypothetical protein [Hoeflea alexandrii]MCY0154593.1 hypothetical protein [Hoeflea alexandrii]
MANHEGLLRYRQIGAATACHAAAESARIDPGRHHADRGGDAVLGQEICNADARRDHPVAEIAIAKRKIQR